LSSSKAKIPTRGTEGSVGYDLYAIEGITIPKKKQRTINTGIKIKPPPGYYCQILSRSGLASKHSLSVEAGVIDPDYTGDISVILANNSGQDYHIKEGDKIAQFVLLKMCTPEIVTIDKLPETERATKGFGSTDTVHALKENCTVLTLQGTIQGESVKILIDSGASTNYLSEKIAKKIGLKTTELSNPIQTAVADGFTHTVNQYLPGLPMDIGNFKEIFSPKILPISGADVILGYRWLKNRNPIIDWKEANLTVKDD
jgi:dUTP pyrophosphatase